MSHLLTDLSSLTSKNPCFGGRVPWGAERDGNGGRGPPISRTQPPPVIQADLPLNPRLSTTQPPAFRLAQTHPRPNSCLKWTCYSSHGLLRRQRDYRKLPVGPGHLSFNQQHAFSCSQGDNGIGAFPQGSLGPPVLKWLCGSWGQTRAWNSLGERILSSGSVSRSSERPGS